MSEGNIDLLSQLWNESGSQLPFLGHKELFIAINNITAGDIP